MSSIIDPQGIQTTTEHISNVISADWQELPDMLKHFEENHPLIKKAHAHIEHFVQKKKAQIVLASLVAASLFVPPKHKAVYINRTPASWVEPRAGRPAIGGDMPQPTPSYV